MVGLFGPKKGAFLVTSSRFLPLGNVRTVVLLERGRLIESCTTNKQTRKLFFCLKSCFTCYEKCVSIVKVTRSARFLHHLNKKKKKENDLYRNPTQRKESC